jgi:hypothetical protein
LRKRTIQLFLRSLQLGILKSSSQDAHLNKAQYFFDTIFQVELEDFTPSAVYLAPAIEQEYANKQEYVGGFEESLPFIEEHPGLCFYYCKLLAQIKKSR